MPSSITPKLAHPDRFSVDLSLTLPLIQRRLGGSFAFPDRQPAPYFHDVASTWSSDPAARLTLLRRIAAAKYAATNAAVVATDHALRAAGGFGITRDLPLERFFRDARAGPTHPPNDDAALEMVGRALHNKKKTT
jgi:alkylation response protein AidB-like acyl-CoA dehydrogenase